MKQSCYALRVLLLLSFIPCISSAQESPVSLKAGDVITHSITVKKGIYNLEGRDSLLPALVIDGNDITIDFNGATISGNRNAHSPDKFVGTGILVKKGSRIIIKNLTIKGYKVGIMAKEVDGLEIAACDLSYNYRQRLLSSRLKEDLSDWMSYHHNENDEWLRFGAAIYLDSCTNASIHDNVVTNGQCGLMMTCSDNGRIWGNNFSFNSAVGIGMYRSNYNQVLYNRADWNVRGYSYGYYYRGQDSGGFLVFTQCSNNVFAYNSVTHSGDGFFLWAGQETIDTGVGGCNDNLIYDNDFSYAPTNAVEVTFSRNKVIKNRLRGCWHGIWGGFSYQTVIANNEFGGNLAGISIEHGQDNIIQGNRFEADSLGIELWAIPNRRADFGLMKYKDTRSRDYRISENTFINVPLVYSIKNTQQLSFFHNKSTGERLLEKKDTLVSGWRQTDKPLLYDYRPDSIYVSSLLPGIKREPVFLPIDHPQGKASILMTEWGPYDFTYPLLWWEKTDKDGTMHFEVKGPMGKWRVKKIEGASLLVASGDMPGRLTVRKKGRDQAVHIELEFMGTAFKTPFGENQEAGKPYKFSYTDPSLPMQWQVKWFRFNKHTDPLSHPKAFAALLKDSLPTFSKSVDAADFDWVQGAIRELPRANSVTVVNTTVNVTRGQYRLDVTAGDLVRVYIDGRLLIDAWKRDAINFDSDYHREAMISLKGKHRIQIIKVQYGGYGPFDWTLKRIY